MFARETKRKKNETKKPRAQVAGRDYGHSYTCQACWDGGDIVCCDLCPVSVHAECIGMTQAEIAKATRWGCPHHSCAECGRKSAAVGGMLFRCESCPRAFCEDHLPGDAEIIGECKRFQALGQRHGVGVEDGGGVRSPGSGEVAVDGLHASVRGRGDAHIASRRGAGVRRRGSTPQCQGCCGGRQTKRCC